MIWLQNILVFFTGYLLSQYVVATGTHRKLLILVTGNGMTDRSKLTGTILAVAYGLSLFLSHTLVVLALLPIVRRFISLAESREEEKKMATLMYITLVVGANIGSMASLTGSPVNLVVVGIAEMYHLEGRRVLNFISWLLWGVPSTIGLLYSAKHLIGLLAGTGNGKQLYIGTIRRASPVINRPILYFAGNLILVISLAITESLFSPPAILFCFNPVDICFLAYAGVMLYTLFVMPRKTITAKGTTKNALFTLLVILWLPMYGTCRIIDECGSRTNTRQLRRIAAWLDNLQILVFRNVWRHCFGQHLLSLDAPAASRPMLSLRRISSEIPWFGIFLTSVAALILLFLLSLGSESSTSIQDGYIVATIKVVVMHATESIRNPFLMLLTIISLAVFSSEILSSSTIVLLTTPLLTDLTRYTELPPLIVLLAITLSSGCAFMTPFATPASTLCYGGLRGVSLKTVLLFGFVMNIITIIWSTSVFYLFSLFFK